MLKLEKLAEVVLPKDPTSDTKKLTDAIDKLNETVEGLQDEIERIKPKEEENPDSPNESEQSGPKEVE